MKKNYFIFMISCVFTLLISCVAIFMDFKSSAMVGAGVPLQAADSEAGRAQAEVLDYNFRYGHDTRLLHRGYTSLTVKYPHTLGLTTTHNVPAGAIVLDKYKNPGYMSTAGSSEYASIYLMNQERAVAGGR